MEVGRILGSYQLEDQIGSGGMGAVFLAQHVLIGRKAAVKVVLPEFSTRESGIKRFFNEAKAASAVQHPGIVEVYDFGLALDGTAYLVMELLEGVTLSRLLRVEKRLSERRALVIARQIASALAAAHLAGIIHRDLKPGNIFLLDSEETPGGLRVKLVDFGVAKLMGEELSEDLTKPGAIVGTPKFMSPEQCRGGGAAIDWRSDLYSLGCVLFTMLTGLPPHRADGVGAVLAQHLYEPTPRVSTYQPVSDEVDALVFQLMAKQPKDRASDIREVVAILARLAPIEEESVSAASARPTTPGPAPTPLFPDGVTGVELSPATPASVLSMAVLRQTPSPDEPPSIWPDRTPIGDAAIAPSESPPSWQAGGGGRSVLVIAASVLVAGGLFAAYGLGAFGHTPLDEPALRARSVERPTQASSGRAPIAFPPAPTWTTALTAIPVVTPIPAPNRSSGAPTSEDTVTATSPPGPMAKAKAKSRGKGPRRRGPEKPDSTADGSNGITEDNLLDPFAK